jgi:hypothetical protein
MSFSAHWKRQNEPLTRSRIAAQWLAVIGPPSAAFAHQQFSYGFVEEACRRHAPLLVHLPALLALFVTGLAFRLAWRQWEDGGRRFSVDDRPSIGSATFFGVVGFAMSAFAVALILAQWMPTLFLDPCQR